MLRKAAAPVLAGLLVAWYDDVYLSNSLARTSRTFYFGVSTALDFKLFWDAESESRQEAIHTRTASKLKWLLETNGGLYIKLGQALAIQAAILPKQYRLALDGIFDNAPAREWAVADRVVREELGAGMDDLFESVDRKVLASASIAQVYKARLRHPDEASGGRWENDEEGWVAVKVRKPQIPKQIEWDLFAYRALLWAFEWGFEIPIGFLGETVTSEMRKEVDLNNEAENATKTQSLLLQEKTLRDKVVVPKVHWKYTSKGVMTADFVDGCKLTDADGLARRGLGVKETMDTCLELFGFMTFDAGWLHCDPHREPPLHEMCASAYPGTDVSCAFCCSGQHPRARQPAQAVAPSVDPDRPRALHHALADVQGPVLHPLHRRAQRRPGRRDGRGRGVGHPEGERRPVREPGAPEAGAEHQAQGERSHGPRGDGTHGHGE